jgi:hypothetical protein
MQIKQISSTQFSGVHVQQFRDQGGPFGLRDTYLRVLLTNDGRGNHLDAFQRDFETTANHLVIEGDEYTGDSWHNYTIGEKQLDDSESKAKAPLLLKYLNLLSEHLWPESLERFKSHLPKQK